MLSYQLLGERYQVVQVLSQGAFCQTYLTQDICLPDYPTCIVKHFLPSTKYPISVEIRRRLFTREVEAMKKLSDYELVPQLLAHFEDNLEFYLVQEFIEGHPLSAELLPGCCWSESKVFQLLQEVLDILSFVHSYGLIHRDVKPSNIIRRKQDNRLLLIDFGAVKPIWDQLTRGQGNTSIFIATNQHTTIAIGTPGYMPNEQQRGKPRPNSDIYALGMIGIQALTGVHPTQLPEDSSTGEVIWQDRVQVSAGLASVLNKMAHYHFKDRYNSAKEALEALLLLAHLYTSTQESALDLTSESQLLSPGEDINQVFGSKASGPLLESQISDGTLPPTLLYPLIQESDHTRGFKIPSPRQDTNQVFEDEAPESLLGKQTIGTTIYSIVPQKSALVIGLVVGVFSGLILMVVSYWSLQIVTPAPEVENFQLQTPRH